MIVILQTALESEYSSVGDYSYYDISRTDVLPALESTEEVAGSGRRSVAQSNVDNL